MIKIHQPLRKFPNYKSSITRSPNKEPLLINFSNSETSGPIFNEKNIHKNDNDLTLNFSKTGENRLDKKYLYTDLLKTKMGII